MEDIPVGVGRGFPTELTSHIYDISKSVSYQKTAWLGGAIQAYITYDNDKDLKTWFRVTELN